MGGRTMFKGSAIDGCNRDVARWVGLEVPEKLADKYSELIGFYGLQDLVEACPAGEFELKDSVDGAGPGLSDTYWRVSSDSPSLFRAELLEALCERLQIPIPVKRPPLRKRRPPKPKRVDEELESLRRAALVAPDDEVAHLTYAKALATRGDSLGRLIRRMCGPGKTKIPTEIDDRLLGRLKPAAREWSIERGFLRRLKLRELRPAEYEALVGDPLLEGLLALTLESSPTPQVVKLITSIRGLREVHGLGNDAFCALCAEPLALDRVSVTVGWTKGLELPPRPRLKLRHLALRSLVGLGRSAEQFCRKGNSLLKVLESVTFDEFSHGPGIAPCWLQADAPRLTRISNRTVEATRTPDARWDVVLEPFRGEVIASNVKLYLPSVPAALKTLRPHARRLALRLPRLRPETLAAVVRAAKRFDCNIEYGIAPAALTAAGL